MSDHPKPAPDLPFSPEVISYCAGRLHALAIPADREWLRTDGCALHLALCGVDQQRMAAEARKAVPQSTAIWETSDFYRWAMPLAIFDILNGPMDRFEHFEFLYLRILGEEGRRWLPSLYLAAISSPGLDPEFRLKYFQRFVPDRLHVEQEIADRLSRRQER